MSDAVPNTRGRQSSNPFPPEEAPTSMLSRLRHQILAVVRFELARTASIARLAAWVGLMLFPVVIIGLVTNYQRRGAVEQWGFLLYVLVPQVTCLLGLLLWVAPNVNSELEGRTWYYLTARPTGRIALLLGKYINGVMWSATAGWIAATLSIAALMLATLAHPPRQNFGSGEQATLEELFYLWLVLLLLVLLSSLAYGAICTLVAVIIPRRAMMICVAYVLVAEVFLSNMPALINEFTVQHRLANILARSLEFRIDPDIPIIFDDTAAWIHLTAVVCFTAVLLVAANIIICCREYITSDQS